MILLRNRFIPLLVLTLAAESLAVVSCGNNSSPATTYTIGGTVVNLAGTAGGLVLQDNLKNNLSVNANGTFTFSTPIQGGETYSVTIFAQPSNPAQICGVTNGSGTAMANVTDVQVDCGHNEWAWQKGATTVNPNGVYGTLGRSAAGNTPGGRQLPVTWTDTSGNLWLFGGYGRDSVGTRLPMNDLWKYSSSLWTWMGGPNVGGQKGIYGGLGATAASNIPGARFEATSWTDSSGTLWLFGGNGYDSVGTEAPLNDLWKYSGGEWTWMSGSDLAGQRGVYGTKGIPSPNNVPGARFEAVSWSDSSGNLWLFGGFGYDSTGTNGPLNDLWEYSAGQWTWVSGSNLASQDGVYGTKGVPAPDMVPGARYSAVGWTDLSGNFWLLGGTGYTTAGTNGVLNDLWKYSNGQWTWMSGSNLTYQLGVYGSLGVAAASNVPGVRQNAVSWTDRAGNFWLFGGNGMDSAGGMGVLNDLWKYSNGEWTWMSGPKVMNQAGLYGTQGMLAPGNIPGGRTDACGWIDTKGNLWLLGGYGFPASGTEGDLNDLWMYMP